MNTRRRKEKFRNFRILLYSGISSTIVINNVKSELKPNDSTTTTGKTQSGKFETNKMEKWTYYFQNSVRQK